MPKKQHGLGRGLDALLPVDTMEDADASIQDIAIGQIDPNLDQPRKAFDDDLIEQLAESIQNQGVISPILVCASSNGRYQIVAGERRWRASMKAGLKTVPCIVREMTDAERMEVALVENLQREDLNAMEAAAGIKALMDACQYTQEEAARKLGKSRPAVANALRLLTLPIEVQDLVKTGELSAGHARVLAGMEDDADKLELAGRAVRDGLNVRQTEQLAAQMREKKEHPTQEDKPQEKPQRSAELGALENRIRETMGMRASLKGNESKGRIVIEYYTRDELEHLNDMLERLESLEM